MSMLTTENTISATYCKVNLGKIQLSVQQSYLRTNVPQLRFSLRLPTAVY
jgi:hypothetical protein